MNLLVAVWMYACCSIASKPSYIGDGHIEYIYGWPFPCMSEVIRATTSDTTLFCCDRDGPFPMAIFEAHPEKFKVTRKPMYYVLPLVLLNLGILALAITAVAVPLEVLIRRRAARHGAR
jgi:hypothetical protein